METTDILKLLPHRYPFLLVDRIIDMNGDISATGIKNVTMDEPYGATNLNKQCVRSEWRSKHQSKYRMAQYRPKFQCLETG
jgi:hypothetical protein